MASPYYMDLARFKVLTIMPAGDVDTVEATNPGFVLAQLILFSDHITARLAKRYVVPFGDGPTTGLRTNVPACVERWLVHLVTPMVYGKRGVNPSSGDLWFERFVIKPADMAETELSEAADSNTGKFDLPLRADAPGGSNATRSGPKIYTETSPYVWTDLERVAGQEEDGTGEGTQ